MRSDRRSETSSYVLRPIGHPKTGYTTSAAKIQPFFKYKKKLAGFFSKLTKSGGFLRSLELRVESLESERKFRVKREEGRVKREEFRVMSSE